MTGQRTRGPGRRPGAPDTRGAILEAARTLFASRGYDATTLRGVAREAAVDPALVHHYFTGKHDLFMQAMNVPFDPAAMAEKVFEGDRADLGERLVRTFLQVWEQPEGLPRLVGFVRAIVSNEATATSLREAFSATLFDRLAPLVGAPDAKLRLNAVGSQLIGLAMARYLVGFEPIASADVDDLVRLFGPTVQRYLTEEL